MTKEKIKKLKFICKLLGYKISNIDLKDNLRYPLNHYKCNFIYNKCRKRVNTYWDENSGACVLCKKLKNFTK